MNWHRLPAILFVPAVLAAAAAPETAAGRFLRLHWFERGSAHGNPGTDKDRFRVNAPEAVISRFASRSETSASGMMQILMREDLTRLAGAELYLELWGGHPYTSNKRVTPNGRTTYPIPEVGAAGGHCTHHYPVIPLKITDLVNGYNALQFACDQGKSFWGHYIVDNACIRAVLKRDHPDLAAAGLAGFDAAVRARPAAGDERMELELEVAGGAADQVAEVEFHGFYEGFDENGDGATTDWHGFTKARNPAAIAGAASAPPFRAVWDTSMVIGGEARFRALVRFRGLPQLVYETAATAPAALPSKGRAAVRQFLCAEIPAPFTSRIKREKTCRIPVDIDPSSIERAELHVVVWDGGRGTVEDYFTLNGRALPVAGQGRHDVIYSQVPLEPALLRRGPNLVRLLSDTEHHGIEVLLPGPAIVVRYRR